VCDAGRCRATLRRLRGALSAGRRPAAAVRELRRGRVPRLRRSVAELRRVRRVRRCSPCGEGAGSWGRDSLLSLSLSLSLSFSLRLGRLLNMWATSRYHSTAEAFNFSKALPSSNDSKDSRADK
jgi:hypothetical protein